MGALEMSNFMSGACSGQHLCHVIPDKIGGGPSLRALIARLHPPGSAVRQLQQRIVAGAGSASLVRMAVTQSVLRGENHASWIGNAATVTPLQRLQQPTVLHE